VKHLSGTLECMSISTDSSYARCAVVDNTTPYAWPWNGGLTGAATAVVVVSPAGGIPTLDKTVVDPAVKAAMVVADAVARSGGTVLHVVTQPSTQRPFAETSWIAEPPQHSALGWFPCLIPDDTIVAAGVDGFFDSSLESVLRRRRIERVILCTRPCDQLTIADMNAYSYSMHALPTTNRCLPPPYP
jgi:hypothetical protein